MDSSRDKADIAVRLGLVWAFAATVYQGVRWPNDWARAHWLVSYDFGFLKRGLPGSLLRPFLPGPENASRVEWTVNLVALALLAAFLVALVGVCRRILQRTGGEPVAILTLLVFLTSPFVLMSAHTVGYGDNIIFLLASVSGLLVIRGRLLAAGVVLVIGVLVHESIILVGFPSVLFLALLRHEAAPPARASFLRSHLWLVLPPLATLAVIVGVQAAWLDSTSLEARLVEHLARYECVRQDRHLIVPEAFTTPFAEYLHQWAEFRARILAPFYWVHIGLPSGVLMFAAGWRLRRHPRRWSLCGALAVTVALPLALHMVAWDTGRIWTYPLLAGLFGLWGVAEFLPGMPTEDHIVRVFGVLAVAIVVEQVFRNTPLLDGLVEAPARLWRALLFGPAVGLVMWGLLRRQPPRSKDPEDLLHQ